MAHKIKKTNSAEGVQPNLFNYELCYESFSWQQAEKDFITGLPVSDSSQAESRERVNIAYEAVDRHLINGLGDKVAIRWLGKQDQVLDISYSELAKQTNRFANVLNALDLEPGSRVFSLAGRLPQLYITALGTLKAGCIFTPLFSAFGPEPVRSRLEIGEANVLVTTASLYRKKIARWWQELPHLKYIILIDGDEPSCLSFSSLMADSGENFSCYPTEKEDRALLHFTSGTTGKPKGVVHVHGAVLSHMVSAYYALDLHESDIYWCTADPGWVTGTSYGIIAPLCHGVTMIVDEAEFDAYRWYQILEQQKVTVWYTAPTAIRLLMKYGAELAHNYKLDALRFMASVGEALNPEAVIWGEQTFGKPFHDNWWQTETGAILMANCVSSDVKPGSMGRPLPGIKAAIVSRNASGQLVEENEPNVIGELAIAQDWPSMFVAYLNQQERYSTCFEDGWYLSGDLAKCDEDGYYWFVSRVDDLIKSSGHLIGPFEVESVLMEDPAIAEAAVIGIPDPIVGEVVKAFVSLKSDYTASEDLRKQLRALCRKRLGTAVAPKEIEFRQDLPKTRSGKIMRRLLKNRELGLPEGDISTLDNSSSALNNGSFNHAKVNNDG